MDAFTAVKTSEHWYLIRSPQDITANTDICTTARNSNLTYDLGFHISPSSKTLPNVIRH